jgi:hypothetical protein
LQCGQAGFAAVTSGFAAFAGVAVSSAEANDAIANVNNATKVKLIIFFVISVLLFSGLQISSNTKPPIETHFQTKALNCGENLRCLASLHSSRRQFYRRNRYSQLPSFKFTPIFQKFFPKRLIFVQK